MRLAGKAENLANQTTKFAEIGARQCGDSRCPANRAHGAQQTITFVPHADLASLDPVWTTADVTRNFALAVYDTLYGYDAEFNAQPQMVEGHAIENDGLQ